MPHAPTTHSCVPTPEPRPSLHRLISAPWRVLPDFLLIGAQKSGTTDLDRRISRSPRILPRAAKECRILAGPRPSRSRCRSLQETVFRRAGLRRRLGGRFRAGDACPYYLFHPRTPKIARDLLGPELDLVVLLRDPALRAWSHHRHERRLGVETLDFEDAIEQEPARLAGETQRLLDDADAVSGLHEHFSYLARGRYAEQLERWFEAFGSERILVLFSEDHFEDPEGTSNRVLDWLGIPPNPSDAAPPIANRGDGEAPPPEILHRLRTHFAPQNEQLARLLGRPVPWPDS
ncbi:MAG: sulfotransferase [Phycisphaera sp. TMED9]|nr:MAG: sulfotransferase [Phycisphaera sp. TMED9]